jgi:predicted HTH domain antitoxin
MTRITLELTEASLDEAVARPSAFLAEVRLAAAAELFASDKLTLAEAARLADVSWSTLRERAERLPCNGYAEYEAWPLPTPYASCGADSDQPCD